tara:strand:+ start:1709 stop:3139 length:1431 start_codon:yes stop_codon:yes gene_type:complete
MSKKSNQTLSISNPKIIKFFEQHNNLDFEDTILSFIDIMEKLSDSMNNSINNSLITDILSNLKNMNSRIDSIDNNVVKYQSESLSNLSLKLGEFKKEYINDVRLVLTSNVSEKIEPLMKEQLSILFDKTSSIIPHHNTEIQKSIKLALDNLSNSISIDTQKLLQNSITQESLNKFISEVETKLSSTFHNTITSTEQRLDNKISDIGEKTNSQLNSTSSLNTSVSELLKKLENSSAKGKMSENILVNILHSLYPASQIDHVGQTKETGDVILTRKDKPKILIENKDWSKNVVQEEVKKFIHDIETQKCCGVFLSQNFGIANKENFEINIHDGNVLIYVHETKNDPEKIKIAIDIIDHIKEQLDEFDSDDEVDSISKEKLNSINCEFQAFIASKLSLIKLLKDFNQKALRQIDDIKIPTLEEYLSTRFATSSSKYVCEFCGFVAKNAAAKSAHLRGCTAKKNQSKNNSSIGPIITITE